PHLLHPGFGGHERVEAFQRRSQPPHQHNRDVILPLRSVAIRVDVRTLRRRGSRRLEEREERGLDGSIGEEGGHSFSIISMNFSHFSFFPFAGVVLPGHQTTCALVTTRSPRCFPSLS